jgi:hypothetical protein
MPSVPCEICGGSGLVRCAVSLIPTFYECGCDSRVCWYCDEPISEEDDAEVFDYGEHAHRSCAGTRFNQAHDRARLGVP